MERYTDVMADIDGQLAQLVRKDAGVARLSYSDQLAQLFKRNPALYARYCAASGAQPASRPTSPARISPAPSGAEAEAMSKATALVAKHAELSLTDALTQVFKADPALYVAYRKGNGATPAVGQRDEPARPAVPVAKAPTVAGLSAVIPETLQREIVKTAAALSPGDYLKGMAALTQALADVRIAARR
jgi:hypothetical protein